MIVHIVKNNESIKHIMELYHVSYEEIISYNTHITDFNNLLCGMKIKIPLISEDVEQVLDYSEGFITQYYDKVKNIEEVIEDVENLEVETKNEEIKPKEIRPDNKRLGYPGIRPPRSAYRGNEIPK